jgi:hypothetical protein
MTTTPPRRRARDRRPTPGSNRPRPSARRPSRHGGDRSSAAFVASSAGAARWRATRRIHWSSRGLAAGRRQQNAIIVRVSSPSPRARPKARAAVWREGSPSQHSAGAILRAPFSKEAHARHLPSYFGSSRTARPSRCLRVRSTTSTLFIVIHQVYELWFKEIRTRSTSSSRNWCAGHAAAP